MNVLFLGIFFSERECRKGWDAVYVGLPVFVLIFETSDGYVITVEKIVAKQVVPTY